MQVTTPTSKDTPTRTHQPRTRGSRYAGNHTNQGTPASTSQGHKVQGMQVTTSNQHEPHEPGTQGSRYAGNHTNQDTSHTSHTSHTNHTNQGHKVQGMQVTTPARTHEPGIQGSRHAGNHFQPGHEPARYELCGAGKSYQQSTKQTPTRTPTSKAHQPRTRGSRYVGNHFQPARTTRTSKARGSRHAGNYFQPRTRTSTNQGHTNQQGHEVQGMQVTTSNQDTSQPARTRDKRFKVCR